MPKILKRNIVKKQESKKLKIRVFILIAFLVLARGVMASNTVTITPQPEEVGEEVPIDTGWTPEGLKDVHPTENKIEVKEETKKPVVAKNATSSKKETNAEIIRIITEKANKYGVSAKTMIRIADCESDFNPSAKNSHSTATGLMQFTRDTWIEGAKKMGRDWKLSDRLDPEKSAEMAAWYMSRGEYERWECY